jgi:hypothetical protein
LTLIGPGGVFPYDVGGTRWDRTDANVKSGYIAYGNWGNPGWGGTAKGQPTPNGLMLENIPEPLGTTLLGAGAFALVGRRWYRCRTARGRAS